MRAPLLLFVLFSLAIPSLAYPISLEGERGKGPVEIEAQKMVYNGKAALVIMEGDVVIRYGGSELHAEKAVYYLEKHYAIAEGEVVLREGGDVLECRRMEMDLEAKRGVVYEAKIFLKERNFHITGSKIEKLGEARYRVHDATLTSCDEEVPSWKFTCKELEVEMEGYAKGKWPGLRIKEVPVFYFPWAVFPVKKKRQSGFLFPSFATSSRYGPQITIPYYWVIAPNQDATFFLTRHGDSRGRGFKGGIEYRYALSTKAQGQIRTFHLYDEIEERHRWSLFFDHRHLFPKGCEFFADINWVSDKDYPVDFDEDLPEEALIDVRSRNYLKSTLYFAKKWPWGELSSEADYFRDLTVADNDGTLQRLPDLFFHLYKRPLGKTPLFYQFDAEGTHFWREEGIRGGRIDLYPRVFLPLRPFDVLRFEPWAAFRSTFYFPDNDPEEKVEDPTERVLYELGASLSTTIARVFPLRGEKLVALRHTIEPELIYHYLPEVDQEENPYFDSLDRLEHESLLTFRLTQRLLGKVQREGESSCREYLWFRVSQGYDFYPGLDFEERLKPLEVEIKAHPLSWLSGSLDFEYDYHRGAFDAFGAALTITDRRGDSLSAEYRFQRDELEEVNVSSKLHIIDPLDLSFSYRYNLLDDTRIETVYGIHWTHQCWEVGLKVYDINRSPDGLRDKEIKVMVEITLKGIGTWKIR